MTGPHYHTQYPEQEVFGRPGDGILGFCRGILRAPHISSLRGFTNVFCTSDFGVAKQLGFVFFVAMKSIKCLIWVGGGGNSNEYTEYTPVN